jgi:23S rRNA (adenine2503-C2)-methyltransferase
VRGSLDILGLRFDELCEAVGAGPHQLKRLRAEYRRLMGGKMASDEGAARDPSVPDGDGPAGQPGGSWDLRAEPLPVVRRVEDGVVSKFIQRTADGLEIESVVVPMQRRGQAWKTLCVSSQVGCARGCAFCETAQLGLLRNLSVPEIIGQVVAARRLGEPIRNVVFMGMGEPFDNFDAVVRAVRVLTDPNGLSLKWDRVTISTVGRTEGIRRLAALGWRRLNLAVSLNAPNDEIRSRLMPVNRLEPMARLREALLAYPLRKCQFFMIEYVLIPGVNDAREHAAELVEYLRPLKSVVNVIPYNPRRDSPWPAPAEESVVRFLGWLQSAGQVCKRRLTKGRDLLAACGQLGNRELARGK